MADKKISALPAATTPLAGTEVLPVVQGGATDQVSVANLTAGRTVNAGALNVNVASAYGSSKLSVNGDFTLADAMGLCWGTNATSFTGLLGNRSTGNVSIYTGGTERYTTDANGNLVVKTAAKGINFTANTPKAGMTSQLLNWYEEGTWTPTITASSGTITTVTAAGSYTRIGRQVTVYITINVSNNGTGSGTLQAAGLPFTCNSSYRGGGTCVENVMTGKNGFATIPVSSTTVYMNNYDGTYPVVTGSGYQVVATYFV